MLMSSLPAENSRKAWTDLFLAEISNQAGGGQLQGPDDSGFTQSISAKKKSRGFLTRFTNPLGQESNCPVLRNPRRNAD